MKARYFIDLISDSGEITKTYAITKEVKNKKEFEKEMLKMFSESNSALNIKEINIGASTSKIANPYKKLNTTKCYEEFKKEYGYSKMYRYSYRRVLEGKSTYINKRFLIYTGYF